MATKGKKSEPVQAFLTPEKMQAAISKIDRRIQELDALDINSITERADPRVQALESSLDATLVSIFGAGTVEYERYKWPVTNLDRASVNLMYATPLHELREGFAEGFATAKAQLESIKALFLEDLGDLANQGLTKQESPSVTTNNNQIFIVHGRDDALKTSVARLIEKLDLRAIILHEQANSGKTLIEKFEGYADVGFAVILLTPDDVGGLAGEVVSNSRARQNVIFEHGYFYGKLGRGRVCAIYMEGIELPSDLSGILYIKFDEGGLWKYQLAKEIQAAGLNVDLNQVS